MVRQICESHFLVTFLETTHSCALAVLLWRTERVVLGVIILLLIHVVWFVGLWAWNWRQRIQTAKLFRRRQVATLRKMILLGISHTQGRAALHVYQIVAFWF